MKKLFLLFPFLALLLISLIAVFFLYNHNKNISIEAKLQSGAEILMPAFSLPDLYNPDETFSNQDIKGKYSLINVFSSWCRSCKAEHDFLMQLSQRRTINIYGIAWRDISSNTKKYLEQNGNPYSKVAIDSKGVFSKLLSVSGTPESFIIDDNGKIIYHQRGPIDEKILKFLLIQ